MIWRIGRMAMSENSYHVYFTNFRYAVHGFSTVREAVDYLREKCFMGGVYDRYNELMVSFDPIGGITYTHSDIKV